MLGAYCLWNQKDRTRPGILKKARRKTVQLEANPYGELASMTPANAAGDSTQL